jgi:glycosyltransferase involved in cell wall biosynthesis
MISYYGITSEDIDAIYNPVSISEIQRLSQEGVDHPAFKSNSEVIVSAGRFTEQKDMPTLIRAFERLNQERDVQLVLLGKGEEEPQLRQLIQNFEIENKVYLPGFVDNPFSYMNAADVFALSSKSEGFGNVLVEAMACGTPVVATNCPGGPSEILDDGEYGILVPVSDNEALAAGIKKMLTEPIDDRKLHQRAGDFRYDRIVDQYESVFLEPEPN